MGHTMKLSLRRRGVAVGAGVVTCLAVASVAVGASTQNPTYNLKALKGAITADGSSTVGPYTTAAAELFRKAGAGGVKVTVGISGTGGGFQRFCKGETDLSDASRPMKISEAQACKDSNIGSWRAFTVANDALTVVVNQENTWAKMSLRRRAEEDLGSGLKGVELEGRSRRFPGCSAQAVRTRHRLGNVRLLHRGDQRQGQAEPV